MKPSNYLLPEKFLEYRPGQIEALNRIKDSSSRFIILQAPTGSGKSLIAATLQRMLSTRMLYLVRTIQLEQQLKDDFPYAELLKGRANYPTLLYGSKFPFINASHCTKTRERHCRWCCDGQSDADEVKCQGPLDCPYHVAKVKALRADLAILNMSLFLNEANYVGGFSETFPWLVLDEADTIEGSLMDFVEFTIPQRWISRYNIPPPRRKTVQESWLSWASEVVRPKLQDALDSLQKDWGVQSIEEEEKLERALNRLSFFLQEANSSPWVYMGDESSYTFKPVFVSKYGPEYIWKHAQRFLCLTPENLIVSNRGPVGISTIQVGDRVLTSKGQFSAVTAVYRRYYSGDVVKITTYYGGCVETTPEHLILKAPARRSGQHKGKLFHKSLLPSTHPKWWRAGVIEDGYLIYPLFQAPEIADPQEDLVALLGWYLAEGWATGRQLRFALGRHEEANIEKLKVLLRSVWQQEPRMYPNGPNAVNIVLCSKKAANFFKQECGVGARNKAIPSWAMNAPSSSLKILLEALISGDGNIRPGSPRSRTLASCVRYATSSFTLAYQIRDIALRLGYLASVHQIRKPGACQILGKPSFTSEAYHVRFSLQPSERAIQGWNDNRFAYFRIKSVERRHYEGYVYDLSVPEAGNFVTPAGIVHNCMSATIISPQQMARDLGIPKSEVHFIDLKSEFDPKRRPVFYIPKASISEKTKAFAWKQMVKGLDERLDVHKSVKVLVHTVSTNFARFVVANSRHKGRIISYTDGMRREEALDLFKVSKEPKVLVAQSMDRGVDLPDALCRVVLILKVPFPNLGDKQISQRVYGSRDGNDWYIVQTWRTLVQMSGRAMRHKDDWCLVEILDTQFGERLLAKSKHLAPRWWRDALRLPKNAS